MAFSVVCVEERVLLLSVVGSLLWELEELKFALPSSRGGASGFHFKEYPIETLQCGISEQLLFDRRGQYLCLVRVEIVRRGIDRNKTFQIPDSRFLLPRECKANRDNSVDGMAALWGLLWKKRRKRRLGRENRWHESKKRWDDSKMQTCWAPFAGDCRNITWHNRTGVTDCHTSVMLPIEFYIL